MAYTTIDDPSAYFQTALYSGNETVRTITNDGNSDLQPDWVWIKCRSHAQSSALHDSSRGAGKGLLSDNVLVEQDDNTQLSGFASDGFTLGDASGSASQPYPSTNDNGRTFVAWQWKSNGGTRTAYAESGDNPAGGYQVNTTAGFSIVDWTGTGDAGGTVAHGLGAVPHVILVKCRNTAHDWAVFHHRNTSAPATDYLVLNENSATADGVNKWNDTLPDSNNITLGDGGGVNANNQTHIAYVFTEKQGYSRFGKLTGNGLTDGPFVYTGFKPAWVMIKEETAAGSWHIFDNKRKVGNVSDSIIYADLTNAEATSQTGNPIDIVSNGFKCRGGGNDTNLDTGTYVYLAFAESPFVSSKGVPTTAR